MSSQRTVCLMEVYNTYAIMEWQPLALSYHLHSQEFLPNIESKSCLFPFEPIAPSPMTVVPGAGSLSGSPLASLQELEGCCEISTQASLLQVEPQLSQPVKYSQVVHCKDTLCCSLFHLPGRRCTVPHSYENHQGVAVTYRDSWWIVQTDLLKIHTCSCYLIKTFTYTEM